MADPTLLIDPESVANGLGLEYPLDDAIQDKIILQTIEATQAKVELFLNRPLVAKVVTVPALAADDRYELDTIDAWPEAKGMFNDRYRVQSSVANTADPTLYDVTFAVGLDVANDPELASILTFIREDSITACSNNPRFTAVARIVRSVSADGQSVSYTEQTGRNAQQANADIAGAQLTLNDLRKWKRLPIFQRHTPSAPPWPYASGFGR
jgi:hypothetical protein